MRAREFRSTQNTAAMVARARQRTPKLAAADRVAETIAVAHGCHSVLHCRLSDFVVRSILPRAAIRRQVSGPGRGVDGTADVHPVRVFIWAAAVKQPGHQLYQLVPQS